MESTTIALLAGIAMLAITGWSLMSTNRALPLTILHNLGWAAAFLVYATGLLNYDEISPTTWLLVAAGIITFNATVAYGGVSATDQIAPSRGFVTPMQYFVIVGLFSIGWTVYLRTVIGAFGLEIFLNDPSVIRGAEESYMTLVPLWARALLYLGPLVVQLSLFPSLLTRSVPLVVRLTVFGVVVVGLVSLLQRTNLFVALLWAAGYVVFRQFAAVSDKRRDDVELKAFRRTRLRAMAAFAGLALLGGGAYQLIAVSLEKTGVSNPQVSSVVDPRIQDSEFLGVMTYVSGGPVALSKLVESTNTDYPPEAGYQGTYGDYNPQTWGAATLSTFARALPLEKKWNPVSPFVYTPTPTNVYTWYEFWYRDFRFPGVIVGVFAVGVAISLLFRRAVRGSAAGGLALSLLVGLSGLAVFTNQTLATHVLVIFVAIGFLAFADRGKEPSGHRARAVRPSPAAPPVRVHIR